MQINELLNLSRDDQLNWLENRFKAQAKVARQEIDNYILSLSWDEPLGSILELDQYQAALEEMLEYPDSIDLGWELQERIPSISDKRAIEINDGKDLTSIELSVVEKMARKQEIGSVYLCETGIFCSGSTIKVDEDNELTVFVAFTGGPLGHGGIDYSFYRLFADADGATQHFKLPPDIWVPLL